MTDKPTGIFIVLSGAKITAEQAAKARDAVVNAPPGLNNYLSAVLLAIGTPVTGSELYPIGYINEDAIRRLATGVYRSTSLFRDEDKEHYRTMALIRQSDALALLAARDAEIVRLREALVSARDAITSDLKVKSIVCTVWYGPTETLVDYIDATLKGGAA